MPTLSSTSSPRWFPFRLRSSFFSLSCSHSFQLHTDSCLCFRLLQISIPTTALANLFSSSSLILTVLIFQASFFFLSPFFLRRSRLFLSSPTCICIGAWRSSPSCVSLALSFFLFLSCLAHRQDQCLASVPTLCSASKWQKQASLRACMCRRCCETTQLTPLCLARLRTSCHDPSRSPRARLCCVLHDPTLDTFRLAFPFLACFSIVTPRLSSLSASPSSSNVGPRPGTPHSVSPLPYPVPGRQSRPHPANPLGVT